MKKLLPLLLGAAAIFAHSAMAQTATTTPVGAMTYTLAATTQVTPTYLSIPLTNSPAYSGVVETVGTNTLSFSGTPFTNGAYAQVGTPYFLRFQSGAQAGRTILVAANSTSTLTVDVTDNSSQATNLNTSGFAVAAGDKFQIFPGDTLSGFFGDNSQANPLLIVGATALLSADTVSIYNKSTAKFDAYYFNTTLGYWRPSANPVSNKNNVILYPENTIIVSRRAGRAALSFTVTGEVPNVPPLTKVTGNMMPSYASLRYPVDMTLGTLNLTNWTKSNGVLGADVLSIYDSSTAKSVGYYQKLDGTWRKVGDAVNDQSSVTIPAGVGVVLARRSAAVSLSTSFISNALPYSL